MKLRTQITLIVCGIICIATVLFGGISYRTQQQLLLKNIDTKLLTTALFAQTLLTPEYHDTIQDANSVPEAEYLRIVARWDRLCRELNLEYIWSLMLIDSTVVFTSGSSTSKDVTQGDFARFFEEHTNPGAYTEAFRTMEPVYEEISDQWGHLRVVLVPFRDIHGRKYLIGASMKAADVCFLVNETLWETLLISFLILTFGLLLAFLLPQSMFRTLEALKTTVNRISEGNYDSEVIIGGPEEVQSLSRSVATMAEVIRENITNLHHSREMYRVLFDEAPIGYHEMDKEGRVLQINQTELDMLGYEADEVLGHYIWEFVDENGRDIAHQIVSEKIQGIRRDSETIEGIFRRKDGTRISVLIEDRVIRDSAGEITGVRTTLQDITDRKQALEELASARQRLEHVLNGTNVGTWEWNIQTGETVFNERWANIIGYTLEEISPVSIETWEKYCHPDDLKRAKQHLDECFAGVTQHYECEYRMRHKNGGWIWILDRGKIASWADDGKPGLMYGTHQDITDRKQAEENLRESERKLATLFSSMMEMVVIHELILDDTGKTVDYRLTDCNDAFTNITGISREDAIGKPATEVYQTDQAPYLDQYSWVAKTGRPRQFTTYYPQMDKYFVISVVSPGKNQFATISADITDQKRTEEEIIALNNAMVGREERLLELKQKVNELNRELGREPEYDENLTTIDTMPAILDRDTTPDILDEDTSRLVELLNMDAIRYVLESYSRSVGIPTAIVSPDGKILIGINWERICTDFHRVNERTCRRCTESDTILGNQLKDGAKYAIYTCRNGMTDAAAPIIVEGRHIANAFVGQFHTSEPDEEKFREQAREYGFDEEDYIRALHEAPVFSEEELRPILDFLTGVAEITTGMFLDRLRSERTTQELQKKQEDLRTQHRAALSLMEDARQAEEQIRHLRNYLSSIINSMPSTLVGVDADGVVTQWNAEAKRTTGLPTEEALGQPLEQVFPRLASEMKHVREAMQTRQVHDTPKKPYKQNDETCYEHITIYPLIANGIDGAVIRVDDVTERVQIEEMMVQSEKMLSVGGLAAGMAHEINNPLSGMMQTASVIASRLADDLPVNHRTAEQVGTDMDTIRSFMEVRNIPEMLERIRISGVRAAEIVTNMLSFARKGDSTFSTCNLAELMDQSVDLAGSDYDLKKKFDFRGIEIVREYEVSVPSVHCESGKIQQVLLNILRNGAEAMQESRNERHPRFILRLVHESETRLVRIEIEDNGPGMDEDTSRRVFEPFFTTKPANQGTGLGLSVSYFIITENHNGSMSVDSTPGEGTKFIIHLPAGTPRT